MRLLVTPSIMTLLEHILKCKVNGTEEWKIYLERKDRDCCKKGQMSFRNIMPDTDNPNKYILYKVWTLQNQRENKI